MLDSTRPGRYLLARTARGLAVLLLVSVLVFALGLLAGDPLAPLVPVETTPLQLEELRAAHGLADPLPVRFGRFLGQLARGDLGESFRSRQPALDAVAERLPATLALAAAAMAVTLVVAIPAGILSAVRKDTLADGVVVAGSVVGHSVPTFVLGLGLIYLVAVELRWLPTSGRGTPAHLILPGVTLGLFYAGRLARLVRSSLLDVLQQDYVWTARAKGVRETVVILRHALRNASLPLVTVVGLELGSLLGGAVVTETVFAWPGIGKLAVDAVMSRDYPIVHAVVVVVALAFVLVNLAVDVLYVCLDPRIRHAAG
jgi:ABC-type dipeptide/oligopeptide/nickel transport system permease component